ncbi:MAG: 30S ribosomal protein S1 [bacterium]|nr:30S ribosomal protein S1 [bacterium]MDT8366003.1 30S ribosomal protein S1 [bacterium]
MTMEEIEETEENSLNSDGTPVVVDDDTMTDSGDAGEEFGEELDDDDDDSEDFAKMYEASIRDLREREVVTGTVVGISKDGVLVDVGYKSEGIIPRVQFQDENGELTIEEGDTVEVFLEKKEDSEGLIYLSKEKADKMKVWNDIGQSYEDNEPIRGKIISRIKGGLTVDIGVRAFLPGSQVDIRPIRNLDRLVGEDFFFKIIKFNPRRGNVVLSRRVLLEEERETKKEDTLKVLEEGSVMEGIVKNITDYGAFIDLGGIDGLLHITDLSWGRLQHPSEMLTVGDSIQVKVLKFDKEKERVSLGMKQLSEDPWEGVPDRYPLNGRVNGKVMSVTDYGAFIKLEDGVEGLVHISEMTWNRKIKHPSKIVEVGDSVEAEVLSIDRENRRISLGMKQIEPNPWDIVAENYPIGSVIEGKVRTLTDFGAFIGLEEGIDGLIHVSDMSWTQKINHPSEVIKKGDSVKAVVLSVDKGRERLSLGLKQLTTNPWEELAAKHPVGTIVTGKVVNHADFGTFVELMEGVEGLIHVSEIDVRDGQSSEDAYPSGTEVTVKILNIDSEERKVSLSMKAAKEGGSSPAPYKSYLNNDSGGGTLGDILGASLAAAKSSGESQEQETEPAVEIEAVPEEVDESPEEEVEASLAEVEEDLQPETEEDVEASAPETEEEETSEETEPEEEKAD